MGLAFLVSTENLQLLSERKVFKQAEYAVLLDAAAMLDAVRVECERIKAKASRDARLTLEEGRLEGVRRAQAEYAQRLTVDALSMQRQLHALRTTMAEILVKALGQLLSEADPAQLLASALRRVDGLVRAEPFISVRVSPAQEAVARQALAIMGAEAAWPLETSLAVDPGLPAGACLVKTASGVLEVGLDAQIEAFRKAIELSGAGS
ncbi:type III secretion system stator protein SctL [Roseateles sp. NT4]|uniref:type III secretion system stator protein SctL n=1 Tax=Roseateles sp. NT4 TaxID=3453715 RepID=UPI003EED75A1